MGGFQQAELSNELANQWRRLTRAATIVALITAPALVIWQGQHRALHVSWKHATTRYRSNPYEIEARRAVAETRAP